MLAILRKHQKKDSGNILLDARNKRGPLFSRKVKKYGLRLKPRLYRTHNPMENKEEAMAMEIEKARRLRKRGYGVWQK